MRAWPQGTRFPDNPQTSDTVKKLHKDLVRNVEAYSYIAGRGIDHDVLEYYGVGFQKDPGDTLYNRVLFPMTYWDGAPLTQQGRPTDIPEMPAYYPNVKYRHYSYPTGRFLYGIREAVPWILDCDYVVVVEGPLNVLSLAHYGIPAVASFGTSFSSHQAHLLARFTTTVVLGQDGDEAGEKAVASAVKVLRQTGEFDVYRAVAGDRDTDWNDAHRRESVPFDPQPITGDYIIQT